jgi:hypothetical protein
VGAVLTNVGRADGFLVGTSLQCVGLSVVGRTDGMTVVGYIVGMRVGLRVTAIVGSTVGSTEYSDVGS